MFAGFLIPLKSLALVIIICDVTRYENYSITSNLFAKAQTCAQVSGIIYYCAYRVIKMRYGVVSRVASVFRSQTLDDVILVSLPFA
jgi:hypothetical protein